jgi:selenocysteine lyase/cysteine desulfurase
MRGGTGSNSELEEQPDFYPDALESGTQNAVGLAGLEAAVRYVADRGVEKIGRHEKNLAGRLIEGLGAVDNLTLHGPGPDEPRTSVVSFTVPGVAPSEVGFLLDEAFGVLTRVGLHCAPGAHRTIGTFPTGTVRLSPGCFTTTDDIDHVVDACAYSARKKGSKA